ncbi:MAG: 2-phosphosulfolactate phosphatase [Longimicrobiales bacterium]|nr:2-phosphosulfolactate phosphatase [Longimicrobiales bacterium]
MKVDVYFTPGELTTELPGTVVVIDVLRATSTMVEALANGARAVFPVPTVDDAARIAQGIGRDSVLLAGERKGLPIEGFDLGNAPAEFTREAVGDTSLVMATTNGTRAFMAVAERYAAKEGAGILAGALLNLTAVAETTTEAGTDVAIVCAGREGRFGLDDALCAGALVRALEAADPILNDAGRAARRLIGRKQDLASALADTAAGRYLEGIGHGEDVALCAQLDRTDVVPGFRDRKITAG